MSYAPAMFTLELIYRYHIPIMKFKDWTKRYFKKML
jgi:hypothetical protein